MMKIIVLQLRQQIASTVKVMRWRNRTLIMAVITVVVVAWHHQEVKVVIFYLLLVHLPIFYPLLVRLPILQLKRTAYQTVREVEVCHLLTIQMSSLG